MLIVEPSFSLVHPGSEPEALEMLRRVEMAGRLCYKSEDRATETSYRRFIAMLIERGHWSVIEHASMTAHIVTNRGVTHELVRHRLASYSQESTRYCNYQHGNFHGEISVIRPLELSPRDYDVWDQSVRASEKAYLELIDHGVTPEIARGVLPNDLKAEIIVTANLREWHHIFELRCSPKAHPHMQRVMRIGLAKAIEWFAPVFGDLEHLVSQPDCVVKRG